MQIIRRLNNSYQRLYRSRHLIARRLKLDDGEYRLWDLYLALYDWDDKHKETYQTVIATDATLASILGCSPSKVCRVKKLLLKKGLIKEIGRSAYFVIQLPQPVSNLEELQNDIAKMQDETALMQENIAELQGNQGYLPQNAIVSYKGKYRICTEEEYKRVKIRVDELSKQIDELDCWLSEKTEEKALVDEHERLAGLLLNYEIDHNLIPI